MPHEGNTHARSGHRALVEGFGVVGEGAARGGVEVEHVAALVERERGAPGAGLLRQVVEDVAADAVGRHQVAAAVGHQQPHARIQRQQPAQVVAGAGAATAASVPVPAAADVPVQQLVGDLGAVVQLVASIADEEAAELCRCRRGWDRRHGPRPIPGRGRAG